MNTKTSQALADFKKFFERLSYSQDYPTTFSSFLDFALWRVAPQCADDMNEELRRLEKTYSEDMVPVFMGMFDSWITASDDDGSGFYDALGDLFMECVSHGRNGQFFTPQPICDMMAQMTYGDSIQPGQTVCDPACGSGRTLMALAKCQRRLKFYGSDNDLTCTKMAALNMIINSMEGEVAWMDTLSMDHYRSYKIRNVLIGSHYLPVLKITQRGDTDFTRRFEKIEQQREIKEPAVFQPIQQKTERKQLILNF